tara:strand:- start:320 stop:1621 length:1302 start_codon:yes stop_codon:yes gene_type:complete
MQKYLKLGKRLFPICRSITGNGVRTTLKILKEFIPKLKIYEVKSGTKVFDWEVPPEWNIKDAYVKDYNGNKIIDFQRNNLHLVSYSIPINKQLTKKELFNHIHTHKIPNAIPYLTSYYKKYWGFCISKKQKKIFDKKYKHNDLFEVKINSSLNKKGSLTYGELIIPGKSKQEILISTYICHPSMANNELSGPLVSTALARYFSSNKVHPKTLRFLFIPETIGAITYLNRNLNKLKKNVIAGYNLSCIGDERQYSFIPTKYGNTLSDRAAIKAFKDLNLKFQTYSFLKRGSDERQFNSPGINLPIASLMRTKYASYPEYHTSLDNFNVVTQKGLKGGFNLTKKAIDILMKNFVPYNSVLCEPRISKRKLYENLRARKRIEFNRNSYNFRMKYMNFLQYADGTNDLTNISNHIKLPFNETFKVFKVLRKKKLINI